MRGVLWLTIRDLDVGDAVRREENPDIGAEEVIRSQMVQQKLVRNTLLFSVSLWCLVSVEVILHRTTRTWYIETEHLAATHTSVDGIEGLGFDSGQTAWQQSPEASLPTMSTSVT